VTTNRVYCYCTEFKATASSADYLLAADIISGAGVPSGYYIDPDSVILSIASISSFTRTILDLNADISATTVATGSPERLSYVSYVLNSDTVYSVSLTFKIKLLPA